MTTSSSGFTFIIFFSIGKLIGVYLGTFIERKLALGLLEVDVYKHMEQGKQLADGLRSQGYSVTTTVGYGQMGTERLLLKIIIFRRDYKKLYCLLERDGNVNMTIKALSSIHGKVGITHL